MADKISTKPQSGMRDFLPLDIVRRRHVISIVRTVYERYGFVPIETPAIEHLQVLTGQYGDDEKLIYRLLHRGDVLKRALEGSAPVDEARLADQALRYDLTVPLARVIAQYELPKYFKRYQIQPVWRADRPGKGRFREFYQCDVDITGTTSLVAEAEVCGAACEVLDRIGFDDYELWINDRQLLMAMVRAAGIDQKHESTALVALDKLDKVGAQGVCDELQARGIALAAAQTLLQWVEDGESSAVFDRLRGALRDDAGVAALARIEALLALLGATKAGTRARFVPRLARGLGYYTGPIFEIQVPDLGSSIAGGGRYDQLVGMFGKRQIPAVGLSLGLERILVVMAERQLYPALRVGPDIVLCWMDVPSESMLRIAQRLRDQALRVEVFPEAAKLSKQLQYASSPGVDAAYAAIVGTDELQTDEVTIKDLKTGTQRRIAVDRVSEHISPG